MRFRSANDRIAQLVDDPLIIDDVCRFASERTSQRDPCRSPLADMRKAFELTQQQMAQLLSID